jgi:hypothetical protein
MLPIPLPKNLYGSFAAEDSYIVLNVTLLDNLK